jgi:choline dehydrogenase-like flavoprotein
MTIDAPFIVIGGGPAGTSAALAIAHQGKHVLLLEAGAAESQRPPPGHYLDLRFGDTDQWRWTIGAHGEALRTPGVASPKLRVPGLRPIFEGFAEANRIFPGPGFHMVGAMAPGGLSNAWGCGVAAFDNSELGAVAADAEQMAASYKRVATRMGLSGASDDALAPIIGIDEYCAPALPLDSLHAHLWARRTGHRAASSPGFALGRARVAVISENRDGREACDLSGMCLWGCANRATWSAAFDFAALQRHPLARVELGVKVDAIQRNPEGNWIVRARTPGGEACFTTPRVLLAAGTIASTRLALAAMDDPPARVRLLSNPMAAFLLWLPALLGTARDDSFGLAQLSFATESEIAGRAFGNLFATTGLPVAEFLPHLPLSRRAGLPLLRGLLSSTVVGNVFLPGAFSQHYATLDADGALRIKGGSRPDQELAWGEVRGLLAKNLRRLGGWMLPGSFVPGATGADLHYAGTLPIAPHPSAHECDAFGEISSLPGVHAIDGASLPVLPSKAHTLTVMANADRIGRRIASG